MTLDCLVDTVLGADSSTDVRRAARSDNQALVADVRRVVSVLVDSLTQRGVRQWLLAPNPRLDGERPIELVARGQVERVVSAAKNFISGAYV
jgi:uncharacterized protein (DUF2384 family)